MTERYLKRRPGARRAYRLAVLAIGLLACLAVPSSAFAKSPTGDFVGFSQCPRFTFGVNLCLVSHASGGEVVIGKITVPIKGSLTLQGGIILDEETFAETFVGALGGQTLSRTPLAVPGGLSGIVAPGSLSGTLGKLYSQAIGGGATAVTATLELVGTPQISTKNLEDKEGTVFSLPARVKLDNQFLGKECYVGSATSPLAIELTSGKTSPPKPNHPIEGRSGSLLIRDEFNLIEIANDSLVDNSFSAPAVTGCGGAFSSQLDPMIDVKVGLPSASGSNTIILRDTVQEATTVGVLASEK